jgi:shikimate 5-dehydrogenase
MDLNFRGLPEDTPLVRKKKKQKERTIIGVLMFYVYLLYDQ